LSMDAPRTREPHEVDYGELPELTRGLRALGSARRGDTAMQALFFLPLLEGRRRAAEARSAAACLRAFDAAELTRALERCIERIVAQSPDARPPARRALRARLLERVRGYSGALELLGERGAAALAADEPERLDAWRAWTMQLAATFGAADRCWLSLRQAVQAIPARSARGR